MSAKVTNPDSRAYFLRIGEATPTEDDPQMNHELIITFPEGDGGYFRRWEVELIP
jgi:hypothetical protein